VEPKRCRLIARFAGNRGVRLKCEADVGGASLEVGVVPAGWVSPLAGGAADACIEGNRYDTRPDKDRDSRGGGEGTEQCSLENVPLAMSFVHRCAPPRERGSEEEMAPLSEPQVNTAVNQALTMVKSR